jgi:hypothetical protein
MFELVNLGSNSKHANHYATKATFVDIEIIICTSEFYTI